MASQTDLMKYMLSRPLITRRINKWFLALLEFTLVYFSQKSVKGQPLANFMANHPSLEIQPEKDMELGMYEVERQPWILKFDGSIKEKSAGDGIVIISPKGIKTTLSFNLTFKCTNNQAEYEALVIDLEILMELGAQEVHIIGDSQLVLRQLTCEYKCNNLLRAPYYTASTQLLNSFHYVDFEYVPGESNWEADKLAQVASGVKMSEELTHKLIVIGKKNHPSIYERGIRLEVINTDANVVEDMRNKIREYLEYPNK